MGSMNSFPRTRQLKRSKQIDPIKHQLELHIISAQRLKKVNIFKTPRTYAVVKLDAENALPFYTHVDTKGGRNPNWNSIATLYVDDRLLRHETAGITIEIFNRGCLWDTLVGSVRILISDIVKGREENHGKCFTFMVLRPSGRRYGLLNVGIPPEKIKFLESFRKDDGVMRSNEEMEISAAFAAPAINSLAEVNALHKIRDG